MGGYIVMQLVQVGIFFLCGYFMGRKKGYKEGVDMCMGVLDKVDKNE